MLHTLTHSPWKSDIGTILRMLRNEDDLLLLQDGVLAAIANSRFIEMFNNASITVSALKEDVEARGLVYQLAPEITVISYIDFVHLAIKHSNQMYW